MERIKSFSEFVNETFLENPADADLLNHNKKKMKKNGYVEAEVVEPVDGLKQHNHEEAVRYAGYKAATYLGELAKNITPDEVEVYETDAIIERYKKYPDLPRVAYVYM